jgi:hypothetical protein
VTIGLGYIFEKENATISYKGVEEATENTKTEPIQEPVTKKPNATTNKRRKKGDVPS